MKKNDQSLHDSLNKISVRSDFKNHKRTQSKFDTMSKLDLIMRNGRQEEVLDESILSHKIKFDN